MHQRRSIQTADRDVEPPVIECGLRLDTVLWLRWMMILAQAVSLIVNEFILGWSLPLIGCLLLLCCFAIATLLIGRLYWRKRRLEAKVVTGLLILDILQLASILYLTGGLENPFCFLLLVPVMIAATTLQRIHTIVLAVLVALVTSFPVHMYYPLTDFNGAPIVTPAGHNMAVWVALMTCLSFMSVYGFRLANEARKLSAALNATELVLAREQYLSSLDGIAAAAAHELGTPLSTITLVARELKRETPSNSPLIDDVDILNSQANRCREILAKLSSLSPEKDSPTLIVKLHDMLEELADPHRHFGIALTVNRHANVADEPSSPQLYRLPGVLYGLSNIIENAVDFAQKAVNISLAWDEETITIIVEDDGPGFSPAIQDKLGEPYVTSRPNRSDEEKNSIEGGGLGLGIFIAKTLLERSGATIKFSNRKEGQKGARVSVIWHSPNIRVLDQPYF